MSKDPTLPKQFLSYRCLEHGEQGRDTILAGATRLKLGRIESPPWAMATMCGCGRDLIVICTEDVNKDQKKT